MGYSIRATPQKGPDSHFAKEFWPSSSANFHLDDPRTGHSMQSFVGRDIEEAAQGMLQQELSAEVFKKARLIEASTQLPDQELLAEAVHVLGKVSSFNYPHHHSREVRERGDGYPTSDATAEAPGQAAH